ncbi:hypothetical protein B0H11DRAFT_2255020 [Mycena galericulata]|nr:hypothetical protein B0H11DRAFT_2255020 [Mycena galericulata]
MMEEQALESYYDDMTDQELERPLLPAVGGTASYQYARVAMLSKYIPALSAKIPRDGMTKRWAMLRTQRARTLVTMGDAISAFLEDPDVPVGRTSCYCTINTGGYRLSVAEWAECRISWFKAATLRLWAFSIVLFAAALALSSYVFGSYMVHLESQGVGMDLASTFWRLGFKVHHNLIGYPLWKNKTVLYQEGVLASFIYLLYNDILTQQLAADEWVRFVRPGGKKPLRVSAPAALQATYMTYP